MAELTQGLRANLHMELSEEAQSCIRRHLRFRPAPDPIPFSSRFRIRDANWLSKAASAGGLNAKAVAGI
jgi:hypothetical protein